jgi:hypothetical protein
MQKKHAPTNTYINTLNVFFCLFICFFCTNEELGCKEAKSQKTLAMGKHGHHIEVVSQIYEKSKNKKGYHLPNNENLLPIS